MLECPGTRLPFRMRRFLKAVLVGSAVCLPAVSSYAIGFVRVASPSFLGQPLDFAATIHLDPEETLERACVSASVDAGDIRIPAEQVRVALQRAADAADRIVRVTTARKLDEPIVNVQITVGCAAPVSRRFTAFLDPPALRLAQVGDGDATAASAMPEPADPKTEGAHATDAVLAASRAPTASTRAPIEAARSRADRPRRTPRSSTAERSPASTTRLAGAATAATPRRGPGANRFDVRAPKLAGASRLQLEAAPTLRARVASAPADRSATAPNTTAATAAAAALASELVAKSAAVETLEATLAKERERLQGLETSLSQLTAETRAMRQTMASLQARLQQAEAERHASPLVVVLGAACALLAAMVAGGAWLASARRRPRWWDAPQQPAGVEPAAARHAAPAPSRQPSAPGPIDEPIDALAEADADEPFVYRPPRLPAAAATTTSEPHASSIGGLEVTTVLDPGFLARLHASEAAANAAMERDAAIDRAAAEPAPLTMESLIDLDQQIEFFLVLGRDEAAIERLSSHLRRGDDASPLLHFRLLEIHRRRGEERAYVRIAEALHQRFGAPAPRWSPPTDAGPSDEAIGLESHAAAVAAIEAAWPTPVEAMQTIDAALFRRRPADPMLDGPACRELLFLYSVARDLAEGPTRGAVDLLLPIDADPADDGHAIETTPSHFAELYALPSRPAALDLDISVDAPTAARAATR